MKNGTQIIKEYLEKSLRLTISECIEDGLYDEKSEKVVYDNNTKWYKNLLDCSIITFFVVFWTLLHLLFLPFLLWPNLYRLYLRIKYKIPFTPLICPGPCRAIDLINNNITVP